MTKQTTPNSFSTPTYRQLFGSTAYYTVPDWQSVLSPGAYFVDLRRLVSQFMQTFPPAISLATRRPDLLDLVLDEENTDTLVSKLKIVNEVIQNSLQLTSDVLDTTVYPFNFPYNEPWEQIRAYLAQNKTSLADICSDLAVPNTLPDPTSIALDTLGIAPEQWAIYSTPTIDPSSLYAYYYYDTSTPSDPLQTLCNIDNFLTQTGLPFAKLQELLFQDLSLAEKGLGINNDFYINATDEYLPPIAIGPQTIPIIVSSTGGSPGAAFIQVGEQVVFDVTSAVDDESGYGLYVAVVDETSGDVLVSRKYVTGTSTEANTKGLELFTSDITALPAGRIVAIAACGDAVDQLISSTPTPAQNAITHLGSKQVGSLTTSDSWGLIGVQGATSNSFLWEQKQSSGTAATTTATTPPPTLSIAQEGLTNLSYKRLDHINRFVRLAQALDWSFTDLDWALRTIGNIVYQGTPVINDAVAPYLAWMQTLKSNHKLSVNQCCALIGTLKDFGKKNGPSFFEQVFCNPNIPNLPQWADANNSYSLTWIVGDTSSASAQKIQNALTAVLKLNPERLLNIANRLVKAQDTTASSFKTLNSIKLSATNLAIFYRLSLLHQLTGMTIDKSWKAAKIVPPISQGLFSVINTDTSLLIGNELTIENPSDVSQNFFQGQITACTVQETTTSSTTVTITATTSDNTSHIITLELTGTNAPFAFTSISIDGSLQSSITAKNVDKYCLVNTSIESLLLSLAGSKAQLGINTLADFIAWLKNAPFSLAQLHFILTGKSDKVLGSDAIANFQENLNSSLPQIQLTKANFSNTCMTALQQAFSAVVNNKKFRKQLPIATLKDLDNAQAHASSYIQEIAKDIYTSLQPSYLTTNEIVVYGESVKKGHSTLDIEKIIKAAFTSIVNTIIGHQTKIVIPVDMPKTVKNHLAKTITTTLNRFYDLQQKTFIENLAALYQVSSPTAAVLVEWGDLNLQTLAKSSSVTMNSTSSLLNIMVHLNTSASSPTPGKATSQKFQEKKSVLQKLQQAAQLITVLSLSPAEASYFMAHYPVTAVYPISLETVQTMLEFTQLVQSFQDTQNNLLSFLQEASVNPAQDLTDSLAKLSDWNTEKIQFLHGILLFQGITPVYTVETITWMQKYFDTSEKLKLDIPTLYQQVVQVFANLPSDLTPSSIQGLADALWAGLQQQYSSQEDVLTRLQNHFNQTLRNRLVPLALVKLGLPNARALYEYLLIDVEVSGVVQTSYVKEAISAVQLYIYRCLNRLESGVLVDSELNTLWLWMYGYREWQANREVFLYPENYIQPELRKNKTDLFSQIESNLKQIDLTDPDSVAAAFLDYMNGFAEIAQLQIVGSAARDLMVDAIPTKQICMVGKSQQKQGSYYYRVATFNLPQDTDAYQPTDWGQWRKINIQIQPVTVNTDNGGVVPTFAFGTWYLFWVEQQQTGEDSSNNPLYTATIRYTHLDFRKNWVVAQTLVTCDLGIVRISSAFGTVYPVYFNSIQTIFVSFVPPSPPLPLPPLLPIPSPSQNTSNMLGTYTTYTLTANEWGQEVVAAYRFGTANPPTQDPRLNALSGSGSPSDPTFQYYKQLEDENKSEISSFSTWFCVSDTTKTSLLGDVVSIQAGNGGGLFLGNPSILVPNTSIVVKTWYHLAISGNSIYLNGAKTSDLPNNTINAATESGIYYLPSGKTTWSPSSGISSIYINCMYSFNNNLYAGTQERGVYYLLAGATTWIPSPGISSPTNTPTLIINCMYSFNNTLYAGTAKSGVYYLPAGATTWTPSPGISSMTINCMYSLGSTLYAGTQGGVYYLPSGKTTWTLSPGTSSSLQVNLMYGSVSMYNSFPSISSSFTGLTQETVYLQEPLSDSQILAIYNNSKDVFSRDIAATFDPSQALLSSPTTIPVVAQPNWTVVENNGAEYLLAYNTTENTLQCYRLNSNANKALGPILNGPNGIDGLLSIASQSLPEISFADLYPNSTYIPPSNYPSDQIDFTLNSAMSTYYWELFFHAPFLIANELNIQQQCPAAQQWYQYIFNPSVSQADWNLESDDGNPYDRFWRFLGLRSWDNPSLETELFEGPTQELLQDINDPQELYEFATDPYDPQEIASLRPIAYQKTIAMHYIDNLLSWGDMLFRENKRESIVEAEMLYVAAYDLLGQDPQNLGPTPSLSQSSPEMNWVQMLDLASYNIYSIYSYSGTLYVGTESNGLWSSTDNGSSWVKMPGIDDGAWIWGLCHYNDNLYAGTYSDTGTDKSGLFFWENDTWKKVPNAPSVHILCLYSYNGNLYMGGDEGDIYAYNSQWIKLTGITHAIMSLQSYNNTLYAWEYDTGPCCLDGTTWNPIPISSLPTPKKKGYLCVHNDTLYVGANNQVYSLDGQNKKWNQVTNFSITTSIGYLYCYNDTLYVATDKGLYNSPDGTTWNLEPTSPTSTVYYLYSTNNTLYAGTYGNGLWSSAPSLPVPPPVTNWVPMPDLASYLIYSIYSDSGTLYAGTGSNGLWCSTDNGSSWVKMPGIDDDAIVNGVCRYNGTLYAGTYNSGILAWENDSWEPPPKNTPSFTIQCLYSYSGNLYVGTTHGVSALTNGKWTSFTGHGDFTNLHGYNNTLYAWDYYTGPYYLEGTTLKSLPLPNLPSPSMNGYFCVHNDTLYLGAKKGIHSLDIQNKEWNQVTNFSTPVTTISYLYCYNETLYAGTDQGLYTSQDGATWNPTPVSPKGTVSHLYSSNNILYAGTDGNGLWSSGSYFPIPTAPDFGIPRNQQFLSYWDTVKQRIYNIRHALTIDSQTDLLPLFQPAINPMDLVAAVASGEGVQDVLNSLNTTIPYYRFTVMVEKAKATTQTVIQLGQSLLAALEKKDAEQLALLYNSNQQNILNLTLNSKQDQISAAEQNLQALQASLKGATDREDHYADLISDGLSAAEIAQLALQAEAILVQAAAEGIKIASIVGYSVPVIFGVCDGGMKIGDAINQGANILEGLGNLANIGSNLSGTVASFQRRSEDWQLQQLLAQDDIAQIHLQTLAAQYQKSVAQQELTLLETEIKQNQSVASFYQNKFTNSQLYQWYIGQIGALYFQAYQLAHEIAIQAENAWTFEHIGRGGDVNSSSFVQPGYWNSLYQGLLAGQSLQLDLNRMEKAFTDQNERRLEITKTFSLAQIDAQALLTLKTTGTCVFDLTEKDFDFDFPGHYARQIKTLSLSVPMVIGPYQNIHATLTQLSNNIVIADDSSGQKAVSYLLDPKNHPLASSDALISDVRPNQQVALSHGVNDTGLFTLNFNDARYLPFEGTGVVSSWSLEIPHEENNFDFDNLSDIIMQLQYTALAGSSSFKGFVKKVRGSFSGTRLLSLSQVPGWQEFMGSSLKPLHIPITPAQLRANMSSYEVTSLSLYADGSGTVHKLKLHIPGFPLITFPDSNAGKQTWSGKAPLKKKKGQQNWSLTPTTAMPSTVNNLFLVIDFTAS